MIYRTAWSEYTILVVILLKSKLYIKSTVHVYIVTHSRDRKEGSAWFWKQPGHSY